MDVWVCIRKKRFASGVELRLASRADHAQLWDSSFCQHGIKEVSMGLIILSQFQSYLWNLWTFGEHASLVSPYQDKVGDNAIKRLSEIFQDQTKLPPVEFDLAISVLSVLSLSHSGRWKLKGYSNGGEWVRTIREGCKHMARSFLFMTNLGKVKKKKQGVCLMNR